jgi:undecaprenyl pyrophosphate phosphatase UppP
MTAVHPHGPTFPPGRYGRRRDPARQSRRRWIAWLLATVVVLAGVGIAVKLYHQYTQAPYQVRIITVTNLTDSGVTVTFEVKKPAGEAAICTVQAHTRDGVRVGTAQVTVSASAPQTSRVTYTLATTQRPMTGEVPGCGPAR